VAIAVATVGQQSQKKAAKSIKILTFSAPKFENY
jgi:hypothetical protein